MKLDFIQLFHLSKRHFLSFIKDKFTLLFSLISPLIVLLLFILFLKNVQISNFTNNFTEGIFKQHASDVQTLATQISLNWMFSGLMSVSIITITLGIAGKSVDDKISGIDYTFKAAPIKKHILLASYILSTIFTSMIINTILYFVIIIYLVIAKAYFISVLYLFYGLLVILVSVISASTIFILIVSFLTKNSQVSIFNTVIGVVAGFVVGAYIPLSLLPNFVQKSTLFIPGTYSVGLFKKIFMQSTIDHVKSFVDSWDEYSKRRMINILVTYYGSDTFFFGYKLKDYVMFLVLLGSSILFFSLFITLKHKSFGITNKQKQIIKNKK
ncbi:MAG: ABC transporter permease [Metamycoplasmataceae bacterium]|uniref:ABC transporter permease n=1 Tax=Mycoplasmopsis lipophila TaxID=2117 RepID=UPI003872CD6D